MTWILLYSFGQPPPPPLSVRVLSIFINEKNHNLHSFLPSNFVHWVVTINCQHLTRQVTGATPMPLCPDDELWLTLHNKKLYCCLPKSGDSHSLYDMKSNFQLRDELRSVQHSTDLFHLKYRLAACWIEWWTGFLIFKILNISRGKMEEKIVVRF